MTHFTNLRWLIMSLLLAVGASAWGDETYTITFLTNTSDGSTAITSSTLVSTVVDGGRSYVSGFTSNCSKAYYKGKSGVKLGSSSAAGTFEFNIASNYQANIKSIEIVTVQYNTENSSIALYSGSTQLKNNISSGDTYTHTFNTPQTVSSIKITSTKRSYISKIILTTEASSTPTVATPTFSPAEGAVEAGTSVSINCETDDATIYYTTDGTDPSSNSNVYSSAITINETKTIKAFATKTGYDDSEIASATYTVESDVPGYVIDFESSLTRYTDWTFTGIGNTNTAITANGGSKYGANINESGNGVITAIIQTKDKVANPGTFTCYVSKVSTNTSSSTWYIQVSSDGENWTNVATQSATSMTKGVWVEFTANLSSHKNVYVRLYYNGSNAIRAVDDIELTESTSTDPIDPSINVNDAEIEYGKTFTVNASDIQGGAITVTSGNEQIATVDGLVITSVAVGQVVITVSTAETAVYNAGSATFTLTVTAPEGQTTKPSGTGGAIFTETFDSNESNGGNDNEWSGSIATGNLSYDNTGWSVENGKGASHCAKFGTGSAGGSATTPSLPFVSGVTYTLSFKAAAWNGGSEGTTLLLSAENATLSVSSVEMEKGAWTEYTVTITNATADGTIKFYTESKNHRFFLDEVIITAPSSVENPTVKTAASGYASYCCKYPIDLDLLASDVKAYGVSANSEASVTFTQLTGTIKGGVPFILKGTPSTQYTLTLAESSTNVPEGNMLRGTLAPTYIKKVEGEYTNLGLSGGEFLRINDGTVKANKAFLPVLTSSLSSEVKTFAITFEDATGIDHTEVQPNADNEAWFDLSGRRVSQTTKGLYIHGGKKVFVK